MHLPDSIKPFNHPLLIAIKKIAPALAAGNSVIVKPSEVMQILSKEDLLNFSPPFPNIQMAPVTVLEFAEMASEAGRKEA